MKRVVLVGAGALGSHVALFARNWPAALAVVDFDRVEAKNLLGQFHTELGKGKNKAVALQAAMQGLYRRAVETFPVAVSGDNAAKLLDGAALVIDCTDNLAARTLLKEHARAAGLECLHGCLSADGDLARVVWTEHFNADPEGEPGQATCEDGANLPFHAMAAALLVLTAQRFLEHGEKRSFQLTPAGLVRLA
jgi:molybdopterin-synthase adenylyltransferase